jgi:glycosyltransferase involved in cell wall biosynthesis
VIKIKVLGVGQGKLVPSYRYRLKEVVGDFKKEDIELDLFESDISSYPKKSLLKRVIWIGKVFLSRMPLLWKQYNYDVIILQREMISTLYTFERFFYKPYIFDVDDAIHLNQKFKSIEKIARKAAAVVVCNEFLADYYRQYNDNVYIIPTPVNIKKYKPKEKDIDKSSFTIGWIGTSSNFQSLKLIEEALYDFLKRYSDSTLKVVSDEDPYFEKISKNRYIFKKWSENEDVRDIQSFDIGIMPLIDTMHSKGKCAFKMIQYMSCGVPVVSSCLPMNKDILEKDDCGYCLTNYQNVWLLSFDKLYKDKKLRMQLGMNGRKIVEKTFSSKVYAKNYVKLINSIDKG